MSSKERKSIKLRITNLLSITPRNRRPVLRFAFTQASLATLLALALLICSLPGFSYSQDRALPQPAAPQQELYQVFNNYQLLELDLKQVTQEVKSTGRLALAVEGAKYELELELRDLRAPSFKSTITSDKGVFDEALSEVGTYRGVVAGQDESDVRLLVQEDLFMGYIRTANDLLFIDPVSKFVQGARPEQVVVYRDRDIRPDSRGACGSIALGKQGEKLIEQAAAVEAAAVTSTPRKVEIATDADFEFFQANGANSNTVIQGIINQVDGIYLSQVNLSFAITFQNVFATATDPYTTTDSGMLLNQFRTEWTNNRTTVPRDLAHLFTGRNVAGGIVGIAWIGVVCNNSAFAYGLSQNIAAVASVAAHEIGHNFGADHDDQFNPPTAVCDGTGPIMCSAVQGAGATQFSQRSKDDIATHVNNNGSCLDETLGLWVGASNGSNTFNGSRWTILPTSSSMKTFAGDFNGDGRADVLKIDASNNCNGGLWVGLSDGSRYNFAKWATWCTPTNIKVLTGDFNGDGRTDVMKFDPSNNCTGGLWVGISNGVNTFNTSQWATWCTPADIKVFAGDFNGDGKTDVMKVDPSSNCNGGLWVGISNGVNSFNTTRWATWCTPTTIKVLTGDFNGDGKTDVMKFDPSSNCTGGLWVGISNGVNTFNTSQWATWCTPSDIKVFAGDFNGDGKTDVMKFDASSNCTGGLWVGISNGLNTFNTTRWATWCTPTSIKVLTGDFNRDGKTDVMKFDESNNCGGGLWVGLSNGSNTFNTTRWATWCTPSNIQVLAGDFTGDGKTDVMKFDVP